MIEGGCLEARAPGPDLGELLDVTAGGGQGGREAWAGMREGRCVSELHRDGVGTPGWGDGPRFRGVSKG